MRILPPALLRVGLTLRGLWERRGLSLAVLVVTVISVAMAAVGPIFVESARTVLIHSALRDAEPTGRGWRFVGEDGKVAERVAEFTADVPFLRPTIAGLELVSPEAKSRRNHPLMWQDGQCAHVVLVEGRCPRAAGEIMVSEASGFPLGKRVALTGLTEIPDDIEDLKKPPRPARMKVVGIYRPADIDADFWFGRNLFPQTAGATEGNGDPLFTVPQTKARTMTTGSRGWTEMAIVFLDPSRITGLDIPRIEALAARAEAINSSTTSMLVFTNIAATLVELRTHTGTLGVPALLVIAQIVGIGWLLLFLTVADLVTARTAEIALARLRGQSLLRVWRFGLGEPVLLLIASLPLGVVFGMAVARLLGDALLPAATPVVLPPTAVLAGAAVPLGGLVAAALAARRAALRPVVEEWRPAPGAREPRRWLDLVILTCTALGLVELLATGVITETSGQRASAMAVPALIAVAAALLTARLVPAAARSFFGLTRRAGGLGIFLALRQIARGGTAPGTIVVLCTAFALATFATSTWSVVVANFERVARTHNGADTVLTVQVRSIDELRQVVERADPSGAMAAPVVTVAGPPRMLATDPERFAQVAYWTGRPMPQPGELSSLLRTDVAPRVMLRGDRLRLALQPVEMPKGWRVRLYVDLRVPGEQVRRLIPLGEPGERVTALEWGLPPACREADCELRGIRADVAFLVGADLTKQSAVTVQLTGLSVRSDGRWRQVDAGLTDPGRWRGRGQVDRDGMTLTVTAFGKAEMEPRTFPQPMPALVNAPLSDKYAPGLDDAFLAGYAPVKPDPALPGLDGPGSIVDLEMADRVAFSVTPKAVYQVWVAPGYLERVRAALNAQDVRITRSTRVDDLIAGYTSQGPGLALVLLLLAASAAAALALARAVLALYGAARRRGHELAALEAAGVPAGALRRALLLEQFLTLSTGTLAGVGAGLVAAWVALPRIPQFARQPITPPLLYEPDLAVVAAVAGGALLAALLAAAVTAEILLRGVRMEWLRETSG